MNFPTQTKIDLQSPKIFIIFPEALYMYGAKISRIYLGADYKLAVKRTYETTVEISLPRAPFHAPKFK